MDKAVNTASAEDCALINLRYYDARTITGVTQANPGVVTYTGEPLGNGNTVYIHNVVGMTELNGNSYVVANESGGTFELSSTNTTGFTAYSSGGKVDRRAQNVNDTAHNGSDALPANGCKYVFDGIENNAEDIGVFVSTDATPSVENGNLWQTAGTTAITDFDDGYVGQCIHVQAKSSITITDGS